MKFRDLSLPGTVIRDLPIDFLFSKTLPMGHLKATVKHGQPSELAKKHGTI